MSASDLLLGGMIGSRNQKMVTDAAIDRAEHAEDLLRKVAAERNQFKRRFEVERVSRQSWQEWALERSRYMKEHGIDLAEVENMPEAAKAEIRAKIEAETQRIEAIAAGRKP